MPRKMSDDERRRWKAQNAEWARQQQEFAALYERLKARWRGRTSGASGVGASFAAFC